MARINKVVIEYDLDRKMQALYTEPDGTTISVRAKLKSIDVKDVCKGDPMAKDIKEDVTLIDVLDGMRNHRHPGDIIGVEDSILRETVFEALAHYMSVPYAVIYRLWLAD